MRMHAPAATRNADPILEQLRTLLPGSGSVLEVSSGTGQHCAHFAAALASLQFQPTEFDASKLDSIRAWTEDLPNVLPPLHLDVCAPTWPVEGADAVFCANMIHIAPPAATKGLIAGCGRLLPAAAPLILYGPFRVEGRHTAPSNVRFEAWLKDQDESFGVRDLGWIRELGALARLEHTETIEMPANNKIVVLRRLS